MHACVQLRPSEMDAALPHSPSESQDLGTATRADFAPAHAYGFLLVKQVSQDQNSRADVHERLFR